MSINFRRLITWTAAAALSGPCLTAAPNELVVGRVVSSSQASLAGVPVPSGGTIVKDDVLSTARGGSALVRLSSATQTTLGGGTTVLFHKTASRLSLQVSSGTLAIETLGNDGPLVETTEYKAEPAEPGRSAYLVVVLPNKKTVITARRGNVSVREISSGKTYLLPEGYKAVSADDSGAVSPQEKEQPKQAPNIPAGQSTQTPRHKSNTTLIIVLAAGAAGGITAVAAAGGGGGPASPSGP